MKRFNFRIRTEREAVPMTESKSFREVLEDVTAGLGELEDRSDNKEYTFPKGVSDIDYDLNVEVTLYPRVSRLGTETDIDFSSRLASRLGLGSDGKEVKPSVEPSVPEPKAD